ncbi:unnamed protein product, partial [Owenia fusiformis]
HFKYNCAKMGLLTYLYLLHVHISLAQCFGFKDLVISRSKLKIYTKDERSPQIKTAGCRGGTYKLNSDDNSFDNCNYYVCARGEWLLRRCPDGRGILPEMYNLKEDALDEITDVFPCVKTSRFCTSTLLDRGVSKTVTNICGVDLVMVIDVSCSIDELDKYTMMRFIQKVVSVFRIGPAFTQIAGSVYGSKVIPFLYLNTYRSQRQVRAAIKMMPLDAKPCATHTFDGLREAREVHLTEEKGRRDKPDDFRECVVMLMTDGFTNPQEKKSETIREAKKIREMCSLILVTLPNTSEVKRMSIADKTKWRNEEFSAIQPDSDMRLDLESFEDLEGSINDIARKTCRNVNK